MYCVKLMTVVCIIVFLVIVSSQRLFCADKLNTQNTPMDEADNFMINMDLAQAEPIYAQYMNSTDPDLKRQALYGLGRIYFFRNDNKASKYYFKLAIEIPQNFNKNQSLLLVDIITGLHVYLSYVYDREGLYERSIDVLRNVPDGLIERSARSFLGSSIYSLRAKNYLNLGDFDSAKKYFQKSLELKIRNELVAADIQQISYLGLGRCALLAGDYPNALLNFRKAIKNNNNRDGYDLKAYLGLADAYLQSGDYARGYKECFDRLSGLTKAIRFGKITRGMKAKALYELCMLNFKNNKHLEAIEAFKAMNAEINSFSAKTTEETNTIKFYSALAHYGLGLVYMSEKKYDLAQVDIAQAIDMLDAGPTNALIIANDARYLAVVARDAQCTIFNAQGKKELAAAELKKLSNFINSLSTKAMAILEKKTIELYIEGRSLQQILRKS
jgi:tetratricopeptide (TPR) repeat protein